MIKVLENNHRVYLKEYNLPTRYQWFPKHLIQVTLQEFAEFYQMDRDDLLTFTYN